MAFLYLLKRRIRGTEEFLSDCLNCRLERLLNLEGAKLARGSSWVILGGVGGA